MGLHGQAAAWLVEALSEQATLVTLHAQLTTATWPVHGLGWVGFEPKTHLCKLVWVGYGLHGLVTSFVVYWVGLGRFGLVSWILDGLVFKRKGGHRPTAQQRCGRPQLSSARLSHRETSGACEEGREGTDRCVPIHSSPQDRPLSFASAARHLLRVIGAQGGGPWEQCGHQRGGIISVVGDEEAQAHPVDTVAAFQAQPLQQGRGGSRGHGGHYCHAHPHPASLAMPILVQLANMATISFLLSLASASHSCLICFLASLSSTSQPACLLQRLTNSIHARIWWLETRFRQQQTPFVQWWLDSRGGMLDWGGTKSISWEKKNKTQCLQWRA